MSFTGKTTHLILIDDDPSMTRLLGHVISREFGDQLEVETMTDAEDAKARIEVGGVDIVITDLEMPGISGLDLLRCAKGRNALTQVLLVTGESTQAALLEAMENGANDYLLKPVDQAELLELVSQALDRQVRWKTALAGTWRRRAELAK